MNSDNLKYLIDTSDSKLLIWQDKTYFDKIIQGSNKRDLEKQAVLVKLNFLDSNLELKHKSTGAPFIINSAYTNISISHYGGYYAIYLSSIPVGVDIQIFKDSLEKGQHYFVNENETSELRLTKTNLHLIWSAKEAFYKKQSTEIEDLKNEVSILKIDEKGKKVTLRYRSEDIELNYRIFDEYVVSWT